MFDEARYIEREIRKGQRMAARNQDSLLGHDANGYPLIKATADANGFLSCLCPFCGRTHSHGQGAGHRAPHCFPVELAPAHGYVLVETAAAEPPEHAGPQSG